MKWSENTGKQKLNLTLASYIEQTFKNKKRKKQKLNILKRAYNERERERGRKRERERIERKKNKHIMSYQFGVNFIKSKVNLLHEDF